MVWISQISATGMKPDQTFGHTKCLFYLDQIARGCDSWQRLLYQNQAMDYYSLRCGPPCEKRTKMKSSRPRRRGGMGGFAEDAGRVQRELLRVLILCFCRRAELDTSFACSVVYCCGCARKKSLLCQS